MKIAVAADERVGVAEALLEELRKRGHEPIPHGALAEGERDDWAWASEAAARDVAEGRAEQAIVCCWTGTGASIAANKVRRRARRPLPRRADRRRARASGTTPTRSRSACARPRRPSSAEILDAWFAAEPSGDAEDARQRRAHRRDREAMSDRRIPGETHAVPAAAPGCGRDHGGRAARGARPGAAAPADRPYLVLNFVTTLDGRGGDRRASRARSAADATRRCSSGFAPGSTR